MSAFAFRKAVYKLSIDGKFKYKFTTNKPSALYAICKAGNCPWKVSARAVKNSEMVQVTALNNHHIHSVDESNKIPSVKSKYACHLVTDSILKDPAKRPNDLKKDLLNHHGFALSYKQSWSVKEQAVASIHGNVVESYRLIPWICERIQSTNPGSIVEWTCTGDGRFKQLFISYGASIAGFHAGCRPFLHIDSSHLSGPFRGALYSCSTFDADDHLYPLAFGVVGSECHEEWQWFLGHIKIIIGELDVTIMSDRNPGIIQSVNELFGREKHTFCKMHLKNNFKNKVCNKSLCGGGKGVENAVKIFDAIAYARVRTDYDLALSRLELVSPVLRQWVIDTHPEQWTMALCPRMRWDKNTSNLAECFNAWVVSERQQNLVSFITLHRHKLACKLATLQQEVKNWSSSIGPRITKKLNKRIAESYDYRVTRYGEKQFLVDVGKAELMVDLDNKTCTCRTWQMSGIPCVHCCAVCRSVDVPLTSLVDEWFLKLKQENIYRHTIIPMETHDQPDVSGLSEDVHWTDPSYAMRPPNTKRPVGRPRKNRIESQFLTHRQNHCSKCQTPGHNRASCKNPNPEIVYQTRPIW